MKQGRELNGGRESRLLRAFVRLYPRAFRERFGDDVLRTLLAAHRAARAAGVRGRVGFWLRNIPDLIVGAVRERIGVRRRRDVVAAAVRRRMSMSSRFEELGRDLRYGLRTLMRNPGFTAVAVLTLALGIGATTAIFSVVDGVLLRRLPYPEPERIVRVFELGRGGAMNKVTDPNFADLHERNQSFQALAQFKAFTHSVSGGSEPTRVTVAAVSREFFDAIGVHPVIGRAFVPEEQQIGAVPAVILGYGFWQRYLGGQTDLSTMTLRIDDERVRVVGVMPPGFDYADGAELWTPRELDRETGRTAHSRNAIGRLADGVSVERATEDVRSIARQLLDEHGDDTNMVDATVMPLHETIVGDARPALLLLFGGAAFLLLIASANVVNLLLARAASRQRELAVRLALGAGRAKLARVFLAESLLLALVGGGLGVLLAAWGVDLMLTLEAGNLPRAQDVGLDASVLVFAFGVSVLTAVVLGLIAAWRASGDGVRDTLTGSRGATGDRASERVRSALVVSQVALTLVLLIGAGLLGRSLLRVLSVEPGFRTEGAVVMNVAVTPTPEQQDVHRESSFLQALITRLSAIPGVREAGAVSVLPLAGGAGPNGTFLVLDHPEQTSSSKDVDALWRDPERVGHADFTIASEGYFRAMAIPLVRGRLFGPGDGPDAQHVAVISESLAATRWPGEDPIGKFIYYGNMDGDPRAFTIVGIVGAVHQSSLETEPRPTFYGYYRQRLIHRNTAGFSLVLYGATDAVSLISATRRILAELDPDLPAEFRTLEQVYAASLAERRFGLLLVCTFAATALALAVMGVYGVISFAVAQRTREIGIRMALGARADNVLRLVLNRGLRLAVIGAAIGAVGALAATRLLASFLFGVSETDATTFIAVPLILIGAALIAAYIPARRAARVDPMLTMRTD